MEASTAAPAAAPAAADAGAPTQAPAEQAFDPTQGQPPGPDQPLQPDADSPEGKLAAAEQRAREAEEQLASLQQQGPQDLLSALDSEDLALDPGEVAAYSQGEDPGQMEADDPQVKEFESWLEQKVQEQISPMQEQRAIEQVQAWQEKHPDVKPGTPLFEGLVATMDNFKSKYGDGAAMDVDLLNTAYAAVKAKQADDGAVPAEQAATHGASIETQAGQTQAGEPSEEDQYRQKVFQSDQRDGAVFR
jgi:hypothetical protein